MGTFSFLYRWWGTFGGASITEALSGVRIAREIGELAGSAE